MFSQDRLIQHQASKIRRLEAQLEEMRYNGFVGIEASIVNNHAGNYVMPLFYECRDRCHLKDREISSLTHRLQTFEDSGVALTTQSSSGLESSQQHISRLQR